MLTISYIEIAPLTKGIKTIGTSNEQSFKFMFIAILLLSVLAAITLMNFLLPEWYSRSITALRSLFNKFKISKLMDSEELDKAIKSAGFSYDPDQDIFYSVMDAWQRNFGYCRLYDEAAAPLGMIADSEPIYFEYEGKRWLIELWKGQYDLTTGCEIGVFTTEGPDLNIPGIFNGTFYSSANDADLLEMSFSLKKKNQILFTRADRHWWLTGFKLGEFSEPSELSMEVQIVLKDREMRNEFLRGLENAGYQDNEVYFSRRMVSLEFNKPHTPQPITRTPQSDWIIQRKNAELCARYQEITGSRKNMPDKLKAVKKQAPDLYQEILNIGKPRQLFQIHQKIKGYTD